MTNQNTDETVKESPSSSSAPYAYVWSNDKSSVFQTLVGGSVLLVFLSTWFASVASPILGLLWAHRGEYFPLSLLISVAISSHVPWSKGYVSRLVSDFAKYNNYYYKKCVVIFQHKKSIPQIGNGQRPMLYAVHPHGAFCMGWSVLFCADIMHKGNVRFVFSPILYASPLFRLWCRLVGRPGSADKASMIEYMTKKDTSRGTSSPCHLALPPGGFEEATISYFEKDRVFIKKRTGFVKLALKHGYNVVPVYTFGENQTYSNLQGLWKLRLWLNGMGVPGIAIFGSWLLPLLPKRNPRGLRIVVGDPIELPTIADPTREDVKLWHDKYIAALIRLFDEHKEDYYGPEASKTIKLELW
mmetsp:Transcript_13456/g.31440  ORF Transcript_13456/g.31440 Transcript_13456/m.31440 type:complete len:356 (-) Transcript_13456:1209-2276(-)